MKYLIYLPIIGIVVPLWLELYLHIFSFKNLYKEICVKGEDQRSTICFDKSQFECLKRVKYKYPEYTNKIKKYIKLHRYLQRIIWVSVGSIIFLWFFGLIKSKPSQSEVDKMTEKVTMTRTEENRTSVKVFTK